MKAKVGDIVRMAIPANYGERGLIIEYDPNKERGGVSPCIYHIKLLDGGNVYPAGREGWWAEGGFDEILNDWADSELKQAEIKWINFFTKESADGNDATTNPLTQ